MEEERTTGTVDETKEDIGFDVRPSTVFYEQWYQTIKDFPPKEKEKAYKYIFEYAFYGIEPIKDKTTSMSYVVFSMAKPNIDSAKRRYDTAMENGQKGGRPKKVTEEIVEKIVELRKNGLTQKEVASELSLSLKTIQRVEKDISQNHNVNVNDNVNENDNENSVASYEDNTELADAQTVASLSASTMPIANAVPIEIFRNGNYKLGKFTKVSIDDKTKNEHMYNATHSMNDNSSLAEVLDCAKINGVDKDYACSYIVSNF